MSEELSHASQAAIRRTQERLPAIARSANGDDVVGWRIVVLVVCRLSPVHARVSHPQALASCVTARLAFCLHTRLRTIEACANGTLWQTPARVPHLPRHLQPSRCVSRAFVAHERLMVSMVHIRAYLAHCSHFDEDVLRDGASTASETLLILYVMRFCSLVSTFSGDNNRPCCSLEDAAACWAGGNACPLVVAVPVDARQVCGFGYG